MKPWEEDWRLAREGSRTLLCGKDDYPAGDFYGPEGDMRIQLAAAAPEMARLLLDVQFTSGYDGTDCYWCSGARPFDWDGENESKRGHKDRCPFAAVLRKAGVLEAGDT